MSKARDPLVHLGHEFVEMRAALARDLTMLKEQIHQHGLAATDLAMNIEAAWRRFLLVGKQPAQQPCPAHRPVGREPLLEGGKRRDGCGLRGVGFDRAGVDERLIFGAERGGRSMKHGLLYRPSLEEIASRK